MSRMIYPVKDKAWSTMSYIQDTDSDSFNSAELDDSEENDIINTKSVHFDDDIESEESDDEKHEEFGWEFNKMCDNAEQNIYLVQDILHEFSEIKKEYTERFMEPRCKRIQKEMLNELFADEIVRVNEKLDVVKPDLNDQLNKLKEKIDVMLKEVADIKVVDEPYEIVPSEKKQKL